MQAVEMPQAPSQPATTAPTVAGTPVTGAPMTARDLRALRARRSDLSSQLSNVSDRRNRLVNRLEDAPPAAAVGLEAQIKVLNDRILQIETQLFITGQQITSVEGGLAATTQEPNQGISEETFGMLTGLFTVFVLSPIAFAFARRIWRRGATPARPTQESPEQSARMERLEQAVDAIAIEIERVGESQRYQARILTEAQILPALGAGQRAAEPLRIPQYVRSEDR